MRDSISYLKLDLRISKRTLLTIVPALIFMAYLFLAKEVYMSIASYLFLVQIIFGNTPFMIQGNEHLQQLYSVFPTKTSKMVLGRFLYLMLGSLIIVLIQVILIIYSFSINQINNREIIIMCLSEIIVFLILFIEYPISYKIGFESSKIIQNVMCIFPACAMLALPAFLMEDNLLGENLNSYLHFILSNKIIMITICSFLLIIAGYISYLISCKICRKKEV